MDGYNQSNSNSKKWLAPLVVLMLCSVALTGCAFAYTYTDSAVNINDNPVDTDYYSIDYTDADKVSITTPIAGSSADFLIYTEKTVNGSFKAYTDANTFTREFYVTVFTDMDNDFTLSTSCTVDSVLAKIVTVNTVADITAAGNTATKITVTYSVAQGIDLSTIGLTHAIASAADLPAVVSEIESHYLDFTVTATPVAA